MKIEELEALWEKDARIDITDLASESLSIPQLHHKYYRLYRLEKAELDKLQSAVRRFARLKAEWYTGAICEEDMLDMEWEPFPRKILKNEVDKYIESDPDYIKLQLKVGEQDDKVQYLKDIIKTIHNRGFAIKNAVDYLRFTNGEL